MSDLFDLANLITTVGVDAVRIKPEPGLPEKSSNEILTELFSTFDVPDDSDSEDSESSKEKDETENETQKNTEAGVKVKIEGEESKKKKKKKHKHKNESKDKEKKHKHKKKSRHNSSASASDTENAGNKKKKKKKSKRKHDSNPAISSDTEEPKAKKKKIDKHKDSKEHSKEKKEKSKDCRESDQNNDEKNDESKSNSSEAVKIKQEKVDSKDTTENLEKKETSLILPSVSKKLDDDPDVPEVPKLLEKTKNPSSGKILIKDLKNSEVYNNTVKEIEIKEKEKADRMEDGEISDSDDDDDDTTNNRTPTLSPTPPPDHSRNLGTLHSDRKRYSTSPSSSQHKKNDLRLVLKEREKKKHMGSSRSRSKNDRKDGKDRSRSAHSRDRKSRSQSGDRSRHGRGRSRERHDDRRNSNKDRHFRNDNGRYRSEDRNRRRGRSRSKERKERIEIDKKKLLEIARRNAIHMIMKGKLPLAQQDKAIAAIQAGGKSIDELTDFCKSLSKSEAMGELSSLSSDEESNSEKGFHHPFLIKDRPSSIIMNIRDSKQLPTKTFLEKTTEATNQLRIQFPVSSGQQHRKSENEWIPVPPKPKNAKPEPKKLFVPAKELLYNAPLPLVVPPISSMQAVPPPSDQTIPTQSVIPIQTVQPMIPVNPTAIVAPQPVVPQQSIFPVPAAEPVDISTIVSQRLAAMRKLSENPHDVQALNQMYKAQNGMKSWIESKQVPGAFTGSTGAKVLSAAELQAGHQAWARKDQLLTAQPVSGGMGMALLQKMGWKPGEGLGKNKEGTLEPLQLEVKLDKRGLVSDQDIGAAKLGKGQKPVAPVVKSLEGKHPVSLLGEFCSKRKYGAPVYELCFECGPDHKKNFLFKVKVNGMEYKPAVASPNKKLAKAEAAQVCLQTIGLLT